MKNLNSSFNEVCKKLSGVVFLIVLLVIISCQTPQVSSTPNILVDNGWKNYDSYSVIVVGQPKPGLDDKIQRRGTAKEAALIFAQQITLECLVNELMAANTSYDRNRAKEVVQKRFGSLVTEGTITEATYDENDNCKIVYIIEQKGLKKKASY